jgi:hypothetical protein
MISTAGDVAARLTVEGLAFRIATHTLLLDHTWQSDTKAILLVSSDASATSACIARGWPDAWIPFIYCLNGRRFIASIGAERIGCRRPKL